MDKHSIELEPIYVRISPSGEPFVESQSSDDEGEHLLNEPAEVPIAQATPKRKWRQCLFGVLVFFTVFWVTSFAVSGYFVATSIRHCIHPTHHRVTSLSFSPQEVSGLDLFAVAGTITVHSCPYAKNINLKISEGAANEKLLQAMKTEHSLKAGVLHLFSTGPSFDWYHCQMSHIEVVVPTSSRLNLTAQAVSGFITVNSKSAFDRVALGTSFGIVKSHHLRVIDSLNVRAMIGYVSLHEVIAKTAQVDVSTGVARIHTLKATDTRIEVRAGVAHINDVDSKHSLSMGVEVGGICAQEIGPSKTTQVAVEYGYLRLRPTEDSCYAFLMETRYGQLTVLNHFDEQRSKVSGNTKKSGVVGTEHAHSNIFVSTQYGHVTLVTERPITWNPDH